MFEWSSNGYSMAGASILLAWANLPDDMRKGGITQQQARCTAVKQLHYVAGDNDRGSYIVGFGQNPPKRPHHRNSACTPDEEIEGGVSLCSKYVPISVSE